MKPSIRPRRIRATRTCVGCGTLTAHTRRSPEGSICGKCWRNDVGFHEKYLRCGRMRDPSPADPGRGRIDDGGPKGSELGLPFHALHA